MQTVSIEVRPRHLSGSPIAKKIRRAGMIPVNMYGAAFENRNVVVDPKLLARAFNGAYGRNQLLEISIAGESDKLLAICKEAQVHPITRRLQHVDLFVVKPETALSVSLPVVLDGRSAGEKIGGRVNFTRRFITAACTPQTLPPSVKVEMAPLEVGDSVMIEDVVFPAGVTPLYRKKFKILEILPPKGGAAADSDEEASKG